MCIDPSCAVQEVQEVGAAPLDVAAMMFALLAKGEMGEGSLCACC